MAATQQLPSWMTLATTVYTNAAGQTVTTETTLQLPLTYYGPSIPLGSDGAWTYGGLTSPAASTSSLTTPSTATSSTFTPTSSATSTSSATPTSSSSSYQSTSTSATSTSTSPSTSAISNPNSNATALSKGALIGIIIGAIVLFIFLLLLFIWFVRWNSRRRDSRAITPIWTGWNVLTPDATGDEENRPAGLGSPRDSGEEADSFLRHSTATDPEHRPRPVSSLPPGAAPPHMMGSTGSDRTRSSQASTDYGVVVPGSGIFGQAYSGDGVPARVSSEMIGHIMPPGELLQIADEEEPEDIPPPRMYSSSHPSLPEHIASLLPPPPFEGPATRKPSDRSLLNEKEKSVRSASYPTSDLEDSKVFTARRVRVQELGSRSPQDDDSTITQHAPASGSWRNSFSRLRRSWFGSSSSRSASGPSSRRGSDKDAEASQSLLGRRLGVGHTMAGERPMSSVSAKSAVSGNTLYHDAVSRIGTPVSLPSRALTPASQRGSTAFATDFALPVPSGAPPAYDDPYDLLGTRNPSPLSPTGIDVLDIPAPAPFSSASTSGRPLPPGLVPLSSRHAWRDSLSVITGSSNGAGITIDVLDAEPPRAGDGWRTLAGGFLGVSAGPDPSERRTSFGIPQVIHQGNPMVSERGSLHSMRSHLSPYSARSSSGSAPASSARVFNLSGSNSSRPSANSAHSRVATTSSASLNSGRPLGTISPSVSAFGHADPLRYMSHTAEEYEDPFAEPGSRMSILGPMPSFTAHSVLSQPTIRSVGDTTVTSDDTEMTRTTVTSGSEEMSGPVPWFREPMRAEI
ncbi:hypothetical protein DEU56DRAFT_841451 [Suillus clintonianus]|uniref:uncharacterized protein n=1 Tax=Suillus clintonianus TaxID=1904413 RepID=UPI001B878AEE|nr:uncharacterized protein DEU56DRAFT_841451 [Suillus clintonianus]KAG2115000.1 hypothetical protein DEU56DRAFT_841451 [Suillus clintonianus]